MPLATFSGLASGIDSSSLIKALLDEKRKIKILPLKTEIQDIGQTVNALGELKNLVQTLAEKARVFSPTYGGPIYKKASSSNESILTASASSLAANGTYDITVTQLATVSTVTFNASYTSSNQQLIPGIDDLLPASERTITISYGQGANQITKTFEITSSTTVDDFISSFNSQFSGVASAILVNLGTTSSPNFKIMLKSNKTGLPEGEVTISVDSNADPNLSAWAANKTLTQAQNLEMTVSGISGIISKPSNTVTDLFPGVSLNVKQTGNSTITVDTDTSSMIEKLGSFVDKFNEIVRYIAKNNKTSVTTTSDGESRAKFSPLNRVKVDDSFLDQLKSKLSSLTAYDDPPPSTAKVFKLVDLGISTTGRDANGALDGTFAFDSTKFSQALANDFQGVSNLLTKLGNELASANGFLEDFIGYNKLFDTSTSTLNQQKKDLENRLADAEKALKQEEETLLQTFARLESIMGRLRGIQTSLTQALATLPRYDKR